MKSAPSSSLRLETESPGGFGAVHAARILMGLNFLLCAILLFLAVVPFGCDACTRRGTVLPAAGAVIYLALTAASGRPSWRTAVAVVLTAAAGVHAGLLAAMVVAGALCSLCAASAGICFLALACWSPAARLRATTALAAVALLGSVTFLAVLPRTWLAGEAAPPPGRAKIIVYEAEGCGACEAFRRDVAPVLTQRCNRLGLEYRPAGDHRMVIFSTPTLVLLGPDGSRVILKDPFSVDRILEKVGSLLPGTRERSTGSPP